MLENARILLQYSIIFRVFIFDAYISEFLAQEAHPEGARSSDQNGHTSALDRAQKTTATSRLTGKPATRTDEPGSCDRKIKYGEKATYLQDGCLVDQASPRGPAR